MTDGADGGVAEHATPAGIANANASGGFAATVLADLWVVTGGAVGSVAEHTAPAGIANANASGGFAATVPAGKEACVGETS